ncbi:MAG TPA: MBL fold metallo-hydrolase [Balneolaceae bacterium]|nr:MBL fold metallo-hydrolase [Balneolaceae bacterium]
MKLGSFTLELLSEGRFEIFKDGHINRSLVDEEAMLTADAFATQAAMAGINPVLVKTASHNILLDSGLGWGLDSGSDYRNTSNVRTNLDIFGLRPEDITHVVLSHLHYDHAAGSSFTDNHPKVQATFPNAAYLVHEKEWEFALSQADHGEVNDLEYHLDDFYRLIADGRVEFLSGDSTQITEGVTALWTGGHTPGHQIVHLQNEGKHAYFLGDLLSSSAQLNEYDVSIRDVHPVQAKKKKVQLLRKACREQAILLFYHAAYVQSGRLIKTKSEHYSLEEVSNI